MVNRRKFCSLIGALSVFHATAAGAKGVPNSNAQINALRSCRVITEISERVTCYDRATDELFLASERREIVILDTTEVKNARRGLFGFSLPRIPFLESGSSKEDAAELSRLTAKISNVSQFDYGKFRFRLDDGAVWETVESSPDLTGLRSGDTVTLVRGMFGAYFLEQGRARIQARRLPNGSR